jgi:hypothetical protein
MGPCRVTLVPVSDDDVLAAVGRRPGSSSVPLLPVLGLGPNSSPMLKGIDYGGAGAGGMQGGSLDPQLSLLGGGGFAGGPGPFGAQPTVAEAAWSDRGHSLDGVGQAPQAGLGLGMGLGLGLGLGVGVGSMGRGHSVDPFFVDHQGVPGAFGVMPPYGVVPGPAGQGAGYPFDMGVGPTRGIW